jgi:hypothetical protein
VYFVVGGAVVGGTLQLGAAANAASTANAASGHIAASSGASLLVSGDTTYQGDIFHMQTTCPEPSRSTRLESDLFASPVLIPARISKLVSWTVDVTARQRPGEYWISLNCFQLLTGRVAATAEIRVHVIGAPRRPIYDRDVHAQRVVSHRRGRSAQLRPEVTVGGGRLGARREGSDRGTLDRHPLDERKSGDDRG